MVCWYSGVVILFSYLLILPFALIGGVNLVGMTLSYFSDVVPALSPVAEVLLSHWLLYAYIHYVVTSLFGLVFHGSASTLITVLVLSPVALVLGKVTAGAMLDLAFKHSVSEVFRNYLTWSRPVLYECLAHLSNGWTHGNHPPIVYEISSSSTYGPVKPA